MSINGKDPVAQLEPAPLIGECAGTVLAELRGDVPVYPVELLPERATAYGLSPVRQLSETPIPSRLPQEATDAAIAARLGWEKVGVMIRDAKEFWREGMTEFHQSGVDHDNAHKDFTDWTASLFDSVAATLGHVTHHTRSLARRLLSRVVSPVQAVAELYTLL